MNADKTQIKRGRADIKRPETDRITNSSCVIGVICFDLRLKFMEMQTGLRAASKNGKNYETRTSNGAIARTQKSISSIPRTAYCLLLTAYCLLLTAFCFTTPGN